MHLAHVQSTYLFPCINVRNACRELLGIMDEYESSDDEESEDEEDILKQLTQVWFGELQGVSLGVFLGIRCRNA